MANVRKKTITRYLDADGRQVPKGTPGARQIKEKSAKWYGWVDGKLVPLCANKAAAQMLLNKMVMDSTTAAALGVKPVTLEHRKRPLAEHLVDWEASLRASGATEKHVRQTVACARRVVSGCGFVSLSDLSASRVQLYIAELREQGRPIPDLGKDLYTRNELAELLGVKPSAIPWLVKHNRLQAIGNGKARRYPKATAETLCSLRTRGRSIKTTNLYLDAIKQFAAWLVQDRRMTENVLAHLEGGNAKKDRRHDRRALPLEELQAVIEAAHQSTRSFRGLNGLDRAMLYCVACATGFRAEELASLCPSDFNLGSDPPTVTLSAEAAKNGKTAVQPLPLDIADTLRDYLTNRPQEGPIWPGSWYKKAAEMLRIELDACSIPFVVEGPDGPLYADFHALRHSYIALLDKSGVTLKEAMQLARHSDPKLTMSVYGRAQLHDLGEAVGRLPSFAPSCRPVAAPADNQCHQLRTDEKASMGEASGGICHKSLVLSGIAIQ